MGLPSRAQLLSFTFTESVPGGTVTGEIDGLAASGTSTPTAIIITSQPGAYPISAPISLLANGFGFYGTDNNFTVTGGFITGADVGIYKAVGGNYQGYAFDFTQSGLGFTNANGVYETNGGGTVTASNANSSGFSGITYTAVPEPHQTMFLFLLAGMGILVGRKLLALRTRV